MPKAQSRLQSCMPFRAFRANVSPQTICFYNHIIYYYMLFLVLILLLLLLLHVFIIVIIIVYHYSIIDTTLLTPFQLFPSTFPSCSDHFRQRVLASSLGSRPPRSTASAACAGASSGSVARTWTPGEPWPEALRNGRLTRWFQWDFIVLFWKIYEDIPPIPWNHH